QRVKALSNVWNLVSVHQDAVAAFYLPMSRFWELGAGALLAYWRSRSAALGESLANRLAAIGLLLIVVALVVITKQDRFPGWWAVLPVAGAFLL
ncbi:acyltransferase, partial [Pseudomonas putida]|nr:acyltransferase [Pseudomonas putida]